MQRASTIFGLLVFVLWLAVLVIGLAYVVVWAATRRRPQWWFLRILSAPAPKPVKPDVAPRPAAEIIPFERAVAERRRKTA